MITEKDLEAATASLETALSVRAEKSQTVKQKILEVDAANAAYLKAMGLSVSDAVRMLLVRVVAEKAMPFDIRVPNTETFAAIQELEAGKGKRFSDIESLMDDLNADD